jgi:hypothetical protein
MFMIYSKAVLYTLARLTPLLAAGFLAQLAYAQPEQNNTAEFELPFQAYEMAVINALRSYDGTAAQLLDDRSLIAGVAAREVFDDDFNLLVEMGDAKLAMLQVRPAEQYQDGLVFQKYMNGELAEGLRLSGLGVRFAQKLWDPHVTVELFASLVLASGFLDADELARNQIASSMISNTSFKTTWRDRPALGIDKGLWTVVMSYERDSQGGFLPTEIGVYER